MIAYYTYDSHCKLLIWEHGSGHRCFEFGSDVTTISSESIYNIFTQSEPEWTDKELI